MNTIQLNAQRSELLHLGISEVQSALATAFGPGGQPALTSRDGYLVELRDGCAISKAILFQDQVKNMGATLVCALQTKMREIAGDGAITAAILCAAIFRVGAAQVALGSDPFLLKGGIEKGCKLLCQELESLGSLITEGQLLAIAINEAQGDEEIGEMAARAASMTDGPILVDSAGGFNKELIFFSGMHLDRGYLSPYFITNPETMSVEMGLCSLFLTSRKLESAKEVAAILQYAALNRCAPLLIIADDFSEEAIATLVVNKVQGGFPLVAIKAPAEGEERREILLDLAAAAGTSLFSNEKGIEEYHFGKIASLSITKERSALFIESKDTPAKVARRTHIQSEIAKNRDVPFLRQRLAYLSSGALLVKIGERKELFEKALRSVRAASGKRVVPGGGVALILAAEPLQKELSSGDERVGFEIVLGAASAPFRELVQNCGADADLLLQEIYAGKKGGYNGLRGEWCDLSLSGILDPLSTVQSAIREGSHLAAHLLTIGGLIRG